MNVKEIRAIVQLIKSLKSAKSAPATKLWWIYLIQTTQQTIYTGITTNPARRWAQHQGKIKGGAKYLRAHYPQKMIFLLPVVSHAWAAKLEWSIKQMSHQQKKSLVKLMAPAVGPYLKQWELV